MRAEGLAEILVGEIGERAAVGLAAFGERFRRNQHRRDDAAADEQDAHDQRGGRQQLLGVADPSRRLVFGVVGIPLDERHDGDARLESREAERELRKEQHRDEHHRHEAAVMARRRGSTTSRPAPAVARPRRARGRSG